MNRVNGLILNLLSMLVVSLILVGCGNSEPEANFIEDGTKMIFLISQNVPNSQLEVGMQNLELSEFKITNKFTKDVGDEKHFFYDIDCKYSTPILRANNLTLPYKVVVGLVKRGDEWYTL